MSHGKQKSKKNPMSFVDYVEMKRAENKEFTKEYVEQQRQLKGDYARNSFSDYDLDQIGSQVSKVKTKTSASLVSLTSTKHSFQPFSSRMPSPRPAQVKSLKGSKKNLDKIPGKAASVKDASEGNEVDQHHIVNEKSMSEFGDAHERSFSVTSTFTDFKMARPSSRLSTLTQRNDISCLKKSNRPPVLQRKWKPSLELPRWRYSVKPKDPHAKQHPVDRSSNVSKLSSYAEMSRQGMGDAWDRASELKENNFSEKLLQEENEEEQKTLPPFQGLKYPVTVSQEEIFKSASSSTEDQDETSHIKGNPFVNFNHQAYAVQNPVNLYYLNQATLKLLNIYRVLRTKFYRNELIVDADVEGYIEEVDPNEFSMDSLNNLTSLTEEADAEKPKQEFMEVISCQSNELYDLNFLSEKVKEYILEKMQQHLFKMIVFQQNDVIISSPSKDSEGKSIIVLIISSAICDQTSFSWIVKQIFDLYFECLHEHSKMLTSRVAADGKELEVVQTLNPEDIKVLSDYRSKEGSYDFIDYAFELEKQRIKGFKEHLSYWRSHCFDVTQSFPNLSERSKLEKKLEQWEAELDVSKRHLNSLVSHKANMEMELETIIQQRMNLENQQNNTKLYTYHDDVSGNVVQVTEEAKMALTKAVLGSEVENDNVERLLEKHGFSESVIYHFRSMNLDIFSSLSRVQVVNMNFSEEEIKKLLALSEYIGNRLQECIAEQAKVKYTLERRIATLRRNLEKTSRVLKQVQSNTESLESQILKTQLIIHPPVIEEMIPELTLAQQRDITESQELRKNLNYEEMYDFVPFHVKEHIVSQLRYYCQQSILEYLRRKRAFNQGMESNDSEDDTIYDSSGRDSSQQMEALLLAVFSVILRHISGIDKYVLGMVMDMRFSPGQHLHPLVGPVAEALPLKIDLSESKLTFKKLFLTLCKSISDAHKNGANCNLLSINRAAKLHLDMPVRFKFISEQEVDYWMNKGLELSDLLPRDPTQLYAQSFDMQSKNPFKRNYFEKLWSVGEFEHVNLKIIFLEYEGTLQGGMLYRRDRFELERVLKWVQRYNDLLESVEYEQQNPTIASMISRFYHSVWRSRTELFTRSYSDSLTKLNEEKKKLSSESLSQLHPESGQEVSTS